MSLAQLSIEKAENNDSSSLIRYSKLIHQTAEQSYDLLSNLLQWSRMQTGSLTVNFESITVLKTVEKILKLFRLNYKEKQIKITVDIYHTVSVVADVFMFETVLRNLISNAIKFTHNNGAIFIIAKQNSLLTTISVKDTGIGISPANMQKLFKIETSFSTEGTNQEKGTGLGLVLCYEFMQLMNGKIWVESAEGAGSTFSAELRTAL